MKVKSIETLACDAGWRNYHFVKLTTDTGIVGWSEFDEGFGAPGVGTVIERLSARVIGQPVGAHERIYAELYCATRPAAGGIVALAMGAIENALLDAKAKGLGVPVYELLGGKIRDRIRVYWSHCATWRINHPTHYKPAITDLDGVKAIGREVREKGFGALKTNIFTLRRGQEERARLAAGLRRAVLARAQRRARRARAISSCISRRCATAPARMSTSCSTSTSTPRPRAISRSSAPSPTSTSSGSRSTATTPRRWGCIRRQSPHPISSCETLLGLREFLPYFREQAMDVAIVDTPWNGVWQSMKIAAAAEAHEVNVAPHNFYGHLCTMMNAHFAAAVPNLRIMETDIDRIAWDHELFSHVPEIRRRSPGHAGSARLGHRAERGGDPRSPAEGSGGAVELRAEGLTGESARMTSLGRSTVDRPLSTHSTSRTTGDGRSATVESGGRDRPVGTTPRSARRSPARRRPRSRGI